jgi:hypothetical protein
MEESYRVRMEPRQGLDWLPGLVQQLPTKSGFQGHLFATMSELGSWQFPVAPDLGTRRCRAAEATVSSMRSACL